MKRGGILSVGGPFWKGAISVIWRAIVEGLLPNCVEITMSKSTGQMSAANKEQSKHQLSTTQVDTGGFAFDWVPLRTCVGFTLSPLQKDAV